MPLLGVGFAPVHLRRVFFSFLPVQETQFSPGHTTGTDFVVWYASSLRVITRLKWSVFVIGSSTLGSAPREQ